jgi:hypothetical protein
VREWTITQAPTSELLQTVRDVLHQMATFDVMRAPKPPPLIVKRYTVRDDGSA